MRRKVLIVTLVDWSKSFVDENGSFYSQTTLEQKENAGRAAEIADLVIFSTDFHPITGEEHSINGGIYPAHNIGDFQRFGPDLVYHVTPEGRRLRLGNKTLSPQLTDPIQRHLTGRESGLIVPKEIYYQEGAKRPLFRPAEVSATLGAEIVSPLEFLRGRYGYIIAPKQYFDATRLESEALLPKKVAQGIPEVNYNVYTLLKKKYPKDEYDLVFANTGVVESICRLNTSIGLRQMFRSSRVMNLSDATTPLVGVGLGFETPEQSGDAARRISRDMGIEHMSTRDFIAEYTSELARKKS
jgi:hypothetical protein